MCGMCDGWSRTIDIFECEKPKKGEEGKQRNNRLSGWCYALLTTFLRLLLPYFDRTKNTLFVCFVCCHWLWMFMKCVSCKHYTVVASQTWTQSQSRSTNCCHFYTSTRIFSFPWTAGRWSAQKQKNINVKSIWKSVNSTSTRSPRKLLSIADCECHKLQTILYCCVYCWRIDRSPRRSDCLLCLLESPASIRTLHSLTDWLGFGFVFGAADNWSFCWKRHRNLSIAIDAVFNKNIEWFRFDLRHGKGGIINDLAWWFRSFSFGTVKGSERFSLEPVKDLKDH